MASQSKKIYLHIGLHKTGTTTLQNFLSRNKKVLLNYGYLYPESGMTYFGHHNLPWQVRPDPRFSNKHGTWQDLHAEIESKSVNNIILSSEDFESLPPDSIEKVRQELQPYETQLIVYLRRQDSLIQSMYTQLIKGGHRGTFSNFLREAKNVNSKLSQRFQFDLHLKPWTDCFNIDNVIVRPLEKQQLHDRHICWDFLNNIQLLKYDREKFTKPQELHGSPSHETLEILRYVSNTLDNHIVKKSGKEQGRFLEPILKYYQKNQSNKDKFNQLSRSESLDILKIFSKSNSNVAREYLAREDGQLFYEEPQEKEITSFHISEISHDTQFEIMLVLLQEIWNEIDALK